MAVIFDPESSMIGPFSALKDNVASAPLSLVIAPTRLMPAGEPIDATVRLPLTLDEPMVMPPLPSLRETLLPETTETDPMKLLEPFASVMSCGLFSAFLAVRPVAPDTVSAPVCVSAPPVCTVRLPLIEDAPSSKAFVSSRFTSFPAAMETAPVKSLEA
ncbi:MAG: hypothetical protein BWY09_01701 [Candidatus Hydrogenedentes bacterium ADurb.Bin179]|nr:MAG: hypothetical protein BWY09_01701 [Candidatus Hydrogenedentes bacterium ADurb.Bin179]